MIRQTLRREPRISPRKWHRAHVGDSRDPSLPEEIDEMLDRVVRVADREQVESGGRGHGGVIRCRAVACDFTTRAACKEREVSDAASAAELQRTQRSDVDAVSKKKEGRNYGYPIDARKTRDRVSDRQRQGRGNRGVSFQRR